MYVRCKGINKGTEQHPFTAERTAEDGITNPVLDEDRLVSETKQRTHEEQKQVSNDDMHARVEQMVHDDYAQEKRQQVSNDEDMDAKVEKMLHDAYADARKFAKFPNMA